MLMPDDLHLFLVNLAIRCII